MTMFKKILIGLGVAFVALMFLILVLPGSETTTDTPVTEAPMATEAPTAVEPTATPEPVAEPTEAPTVAPAPEPPTEEPIQAPESPAEVTETPSQRNAFRSAESYLSFMAFSRSGLIEQLEYEGYSLADATYGVDGQMADWNAQAAKSAESYLEFMSFSRSGLIDQLMFEGYSQAEAEYGVSTTGL
jgi:type IV secretory pathway VirB10-like protein